MAVRLEGLDLVLSNLRRVADGYSREQRRIHQEIGEPLLRDAWQRARVRTGRMRSTIRLDATGDRLELTAGEGIDYAGFQHWGTRYVSANRFITDPFQEAADDVVDDYQRLTDQYIERTWRSNV